MTQLRTHSSHAACADALRGLTDVGETIEWLRSLRALSVAKALPLMVMRLDRLAKTDVEPEIRLNLMRVFKRPVLKAAASLPNPNPRLPLGGFASAHGLTAEQRLDQVMRLNLKRLFQELDRRRYTSPASTDDNRHWVLRNLFKFLRRQVRYAMLARRDCPAQTWQDLHDLFVYLVIRGNVRLDESFQVDFYEDGFDPETEYKRLLLMGHARLSDLSGDALLTMLPQLQEWSRQSRLADPSGHIGEYDLMQVEVSHDRPMRVNTKCLDEGFRGWVLIPAQAYRAFVERQRGSDRPFADFGVA